MLSVVILSDMATTKDPIFSRPPESEDGIEKIIAKKILVKFFCQICKLESLDKKSLLKHVEEEHEAEDPFSKSDVAQSGKERHRLKRKWSEEDDSGIKLPKSDQPFSRRVRTSFSSHFFAKFHVLNEYCHMLSD